MYLIPLTDERRARGYCAFEHERQPILQFKRNMAPGLITSIRRQAKPISIERERLLQVVDRDCYEADT